MNLAHAFPTADLFEIKTSGRKAELRQLARREWAARVDN